MKKVFQLLACMFLMNGLFVGTVLAKKKEVYSPDKNIKVVVDISDNISYSVQWKGDRLIEPSSISLTLDNDLKLGEQPKFVKSSIEKVREVLTPVVREKRSQITNHYNELSLTFKGNYGLRFRVFNDGVAYRWTTTFTDSITVYSEEANFKFAENEKVYFPDVPKDKNFVNTFQRLYEYVDLYSITKDEMAITPTLVDVDEGPKVAITDADLRDYPGMFLRGNGNTTLSGLYAPVIANVQGRVKTKDIVRADYIAKTNGTRDFPWRVMAIAEFDGDLINTEIVYRLGAPSKIEDTSWIKSGKIAWDWYNANNIYNVDFRAGVNTETYKYYIDFAAENGIEYVVFDEGWSETYDVMTLNKEMDMEYLTQYAKEKNVGLILWVEWSTFDKNLEAATKRFEEWGIKGIKMDFMNRDDQYMVKLYERVAEACAKRKLLVDYHGSYKPTGIRRTYPNIMTYEGVVGLENCKWSKWADPKYNVTMPFIRMLAGPVDYTPGAMINAQKENFKPIFNRPMGMGTRCHQLAMYVVFESPLQMLADSPTNYLKEKECLAFLSEVPVEWDETIVLDGKVGEYIVLARRNGDTWYLAAMTNWDARELTVDLSSIAKNSGKIEEFVDGINADRNGNDYKRKVSTLNTTDSFKIKLAPGGGWVGIIRTVGN